jgi:hypothetical protein
MRGRPSEGGLLAPGAQAREAKASLSPTTPATFPSRASRGSGDHSQVLHPGYSGGTAPESEPLTAGAWTGFPVPPSGYDAYP